MAKYKNILILIILTCILSNMCVFATENNSPKNLEIVQLKLLENNEGVLSVFYGYPIDLNADTIEHQELIVDEFTLEISELTINGANRYAVLYSTITYTNIDDLLSKIQKITSFETTEYKTTLFNFYVLLDSIANNLNFTAIEQGTVSLTIDTSSFVNQKYYMTNLDSAISSLMPTVDTKTMRSVETNFYLITPNNIEVSNAGQFEQRELTDVYTEYSCSLNNQKLSITLSQKTIEEPVVDENSIEAKLNSFLESKYYTIFIIGACLFIVISIIVMIFIAKSYTKVIEKEEKRLYEEEHKHDKNAPKLYWSKDEREMENKKNKLLKNPNALVRDCDLDKTESIESTQFKRQSNFK